MFLVYFFYFSKTKHSVSSAFSTMYQIRAKSGERRNDEEEEWAKKKRIDREAQSILHAVQFPFILSHPVLEDPAVFLTKSMYL